MCDLQTIQTFHFGSCTLKSQSEPSRNSEKLVHVSKLIRSARFSSQLGNMVLLFKIHENKIFKSKLHTLVKVESNVDKCVHFKA